jgi:hypothetical protein
MKTWIAAALAATLVVQPAVAASLEAEAASAQHSTGAFAGARVRLQLGGTTPRASAGLALAPMGRSVAQDGRVALRFGEGLGFGVADGRAPALSVAGQSVRQIRTAWQGAEGENDRKDGLSPVAIGAIVVGGLVVAAGVGYAILISSIGDDD